MNQLCQMGRFEFELNSMNCILGEPLRAKYYELLKKLVSHMTENTVL